MSRNGLQTRGAATIAAALLLIGAPVTAATASPVETPVESSMTIVVEIPARDVPPTSAPSPAPTGEAALTDDLATTGVDGGLIALLAALGLAAVGSGVAIASRRRAQRS